MEDWAWRKRDKDLGEGYQRAHPKEPKEHKERKAHKEPRDRAQRAGATDDPDYKRQGGAAVPVASRRSSRPEADEQQPRLHIKQRGPTAADGGDGGGGGRPKSRVLGNGNGASMAEQARPTQPAKKKPASLPVGGGGAAAAAAAGGSVFQRCSFMDADGHIHVDDVHALLMESGSEFSVVAAIGLPGAGKSTLLSLLVAAFGVQLSRGRCRGGDPKHGADREVEAPARSRRAPGPPTSSSWEGAAVPAPSVELCVSALDRVLLLDVRLSDGEGDSPDKYPRADLELLLFAASVSHTLVVVMDEPVSLELWRLMRVLAALKGKVPGLASWLAGGGGGGGGERHGGERHGGGPVPGDGADAGEGGPELPRLVLAHNYVDDDVDVEAWCRPAAVLFEASPWRECPSMHCAHVHTLPGYTVKQMLSSEMAFEAGLRLRRAVLPAGSERGRFGREELQLTEREWLYQVSAYWDYLRKAKHVSEHSACDRWSKKAG